MYVCCYCCEEYTDAEAIHLSPATKLKEKTMIKITEEKHQDEKVSLKLEYDKSKIEDETIINSIRELLKLQPNCQKCTNYTEEGGFGGYMSSTCKIYGNLEFVGNPFHDMDASKCKDYIVL